MQQHMQMLKRAVKHKVNVIFNVEDLMFKLKF